MTAKSNRDPCNVIYNCIFYFWFSQNQTMLVYVWRMQHNDIRRQMNLHSINIQIFLSSLIYCTCLLHFVGNKQNSTRWLGCFVLLICRNMNALIINWLNQRKTITKLCTFSSKLSGNCLVTESVCDVIPHARYQVQYSVRVQSLPTCSPVSNLLWLTSQSNV